MKFIKGERVNHETFGAGTVSASNRKHLEYNTYTDALVKFDEAVSGTDIFEVFVPAKCLDKVAVWGEEGLEI